MFRRKIYPSPENFTLNKLMKLATFRMSVETHRYGVNFFNEYSQLGLFHIDGPLTSMC